MKIEHNYDRRKMLETTNNNRDWFLEKLKAEGAERVVILNTTSLIAISRVSNTKGNFVILGITNGGSNIIYWYKDEKKHRENGPAVEEFYYGTKRVSSQYFYEGNYCYSRYYREEDGRYSDTISDSAETIMSLIENGGGIILETKQHTKNFVQFRILSKNKIREQWYWIENRE